MFRILSAAALVAASFAALPASANDLNYDAQYNRDPFYYQNQNSRYNNDPGSNPAFTQGCPPGAIPESFPNQSGRRCALPGGGYTY